MIRFHRTKDFFVDRSDERDGTVTDRAASKPIMTTQTIKPDPVRLFTPAEPAAVFRVDVKSVARRPRPAG
jgi:hypothetical protein